MSKIAKFEDDSLERRVYKRYESFPFATSNISESMRTSTTASRALGNDNHSMNKKGKSRGYNGHHRLNESRLIWVSVLLWSIVMMVMQMQMQMCDASRGGGGGTPDAATLLSDSSYRRAFSLAHEHQQRPVKSLSINETLEAQTKVNTSFYPGLPVPQSFILPCLDRDFGFNASLINSSSSNGGPVYNASVIFHVYNANSLYQQAMWTANNSIANLLLNTPSNTTLLVFMSATALTEEDALEDALLMRGLIDR